jgi:hypothetical protein
MEKMVISQARPPAGERRSSSKLNLLVFLPP